MWVTSTSRLALETKRLNFSKNIAMGMLVENNLLDKAFAVELSESVGIRMGILAPGKNRLVIYTKAIWAKVSKLDMSFWRSVWRGIFKHWKSESVSWRLNQEHWPDGNWISTCFTCSVSISNTCAWPLLFGPHGPDWWEVVEPSQIQLQDSLGGLGQLSFGGIWISDTKPNSLVRKSAWK